MTKRHFVAFAKSIALELTYLDDDPKIAAVQRASIERVVGIFASIAREVNDRFDRDRFMTACGLR